MEEYRETRRLPRTKAVSFDSLSIAWVIHAGLPYGVVESAKDSLDYLKFPT